MTPPNPRAVMVAYPIERDVVVVSGDDAPEYLQGQLSQDVLAMDAGDSSWSFALAPDGKVDSWFRVTRRTDDWVLDIDPGYGDALVARLSRFLLRAEVTLVRCTWPAVALRGPGALGQTSAFAAVTADPEWPGVEGRDHLGPALTTPTGVAQGDAAELEALRIESGVPTMGRELDASTIPAAAGVVERSVDFDKGCFTGQELVARIRSRGGNTPTRLCGVVGAAGRQLAAGAPITVAGDDVGSLTSAGMSPWRGSAVGLAYVKRSVEVPSEARAGLDGTDSPVRLTTLPID